MIGFVNCLKIPGESSAKAVAVAKRALGANKVGHMGTLDPLAAGVLPLALGGATKFFDFTQELPKRYTAVVRLGLTTDTLDYGGIITSEDGGFKGADKEEIAEALQPFRGTIEQIPPIYSAIKLDGKRAYDIARKGGTAEMPSRTVTVYALELISVDESGFVIDIECSSGTYIRSLVRDIANKLGTVGVLSALIRTQACGMNICGSVTAGNITASDIVPIWDIIKYPQIELKGSELFKAKNGALFELPGKDANVSNYFYIKDKMGVFALAKPVLPHAAKPTIKIR